MEKGAYFIMRFVLSGIFLIVSGISVFAQDEATLSFGNITAPEQAVVAIPFSLVSSDVDISTLAVNLSADESQLKFIGLSLESSVESLGKGVQSLAQNSKLAGTIFGGVTTFNTGQLGTLYCKLGPSLSSGSSVTISNNMTSASTPSAALVKVNITGGTITASASSGYHNSDYQADWSVTLSELLRLIQFYNSPAYHCDGGSEDGYSPGGGSTACGSHDADYNLEDWRINLSELLRVIQFYNSVGSGYHPDGTGEDGYAPGPFSL